MNQRENILTTNRHLLGITSSDRQYFVPGHTTPSIPNNRRYQVPVKSEASASPDLLPAPTSLHHFQFHFSHPSHTHSPASSLPPAVLPQYRFGLNLPSANLMNQSWPSPVTRAMSFSDEYDDVSDFVDVPNSNVASMSGSNMGQLSEKTVRRRSSKACDQCRKSKCKCERSAPGDPCKSCVMLGTPCTFLGPSRKRGPPKGYIDAIEARLHQTEALLGIMIASNDYRAQSLLRDIAKDPLAKEIINRVDSSPYGAKGRTRSGGSGGNKSRQILPPSGSESSSKLDGDKVDLQSTHPSLEWQDRVSTMLTSATDSGSQQSASDHQYSPTGLLGSQKPARSEVISPTSASGRPALRVVPSVSADYVSEGSNSPGSRRQRRRVMTGEVFLSYPEGKYEFQSAPASASRTSRSPTRAPRGEGQTRPNRVASTRSMSPLNMQYRRRSENDALRCAHSTSPIDLLSSESEDDDLVGAVGQLSLNEDEQLRYHGKASGLHLLGIKERLDRRNEGGIWRFPKARVWPPLPSDARSTPTEDGSLSQLPDPAVQENLLELYFTYVHSSLPVVHKRAFFEKFRSENSSMDSPHSPVSDSRSHSSSSPFIRRRRGVSTLLLLVIFSIAARYTTDSSIPPPSDGSTMWAAGDDYLDRAKVILDSTYASSNPSTCQALLLMGYREIGIGAMAQAWTYIGMAIRMAQDLGLHRSADGWARDGTRLFSEWELHERKRIWFGCVIMDKYVSTYIGRPLAIFERDFDTQLPSDDDPEEVEEWKPHSSQPVSEREWNAKPIAENAPLGPGWIISCFNASAKLSSLLSMIVQAIYAVRPVSSRHTEAVFLDSLLDKWYYDLSEHLRYETNSSKTVIPHPHILTLHMQYWCAVLLLHRPFIRHVTKQNTEGSEEGEFRAFAEKSYDVCVGAANRITSIVSIYGDHYCLTRSSVFLCYYIFTASIMHVTSLTTYPTDPQARLGLTKCMDALQRMEVVWPAASRALELLRGSKVNLQDSDLAKMVDHPDRHKRSADQPLDDSFEHDRHPATPDFLNLRSPQFNYSNSQDVYAANLNFQPAPGSSNFYSSYDRWPADNANTLSFPGTLSTSVLPQLYSTGLVEERPPALVDRVAEHPGHGHSHRYPQYWNDYSTFPQLGTAYGAMTPDGSAQQTASSIYLPQQYDVFNNQHHHHSSNS